MTRTSPPKFVGATGIRSFALDYCSWHATLIVLVEVTPKDAVFSVVESWKGGLQSGELTPDAVNEWIGVSATKFVLWRFTKLEVGVGTLYRIALEGYKIRERDFGTQ